MLLLPFFPADMLGQLVMELCSLRAILLRKEWQASKGLKANQLPFCAQLVSEDTLAALARAQDALGEPFLVTIAIKNRCCDEAWPGTATYHALPLESLMEPAHVLYKLHIQYDSLLLRF